MSLSLPVFWMYLEIFSRFLPLVPDKPISSAALAFFQKEGNLILAFLVIPQQPALLAFLLYMAPKHSAWGRASPHCGTSFPARISLGRVKIYLLHPSAPVRGKEKLPGLVGRRGDFHLKFPLLGMEKQAVPSWLPQITPALANLYL